MPFCDSLIVPVAALDPDAPFTWNCSQKGRPNGVAESGTTLLWPRNTKGLTAKLVPVKVLLSGVTVIGIGADLLGP